MPAATLGAAVVLVLLVRMSAPGIWDAIGVVGLFIVLFVGAGDLAETAAEALLLPAGPEPATAAKIAVAVLLTLAASCAGLLALKAATARRGRAT